MTSAVKSGKKHAKKAPRGGKGEKGRRAIVEIASASVAARPLTYAASGVDIEAGDAAVDQFRHLLQKTYGPRVIGRYGGFAGMFRLDYNEKLFRRNYRDPVLVACTDGVGTKVKLACDLKRYDTVGIDCVAMNVNDMIVQGAEPLFFLDYLGLHRQVPAQTVEIVKGVSAGCEQAQCALLGGECAEMPDIYAPGDFDIAGFAVGVVELDRVIDSNLVSKGDVIIGLASSGIHSNGYSLVRRIIKECRLDLEARYGGLEEYVDEDGHARSLGDILLTPTRIYVRPIVRLLRRYRVKRVITGMAHITGSGLPGNVCRALPEDLNARIDRSAWNTPAIFRFLGACGQVPDEEMWNVFNMGIGYVVFTRKTFANSVLRALRRLGEEATIIGSVVKGNGSVEWAE